MDPVSFDLPILKIKWKKHGLVIGIVVLLLVCSVVLLVLNNTKARAPSYAYTSVKHGFSVNFPKQPTIRSSSLPFKQDGHDIIAPVTFYTADDPTTIYAVTVYEYPPELAVADTDAGLKKAFEGSAKLLKSARVTSTTFVQFAGHHAITGTISADAADGTHTLSGTAFFKDHTLYFLQTIDDNEVDNKAFMSSFRLNQ